MSALTDPSAERAVLAGIIQHGADAYLDVCDILQVQSFTIESNQVLYKCLKRVFERDSEAVVDVPTILTTANELDLDSFYSDSKEQTHLRAIFNLPVKTENVRQFAAKVRKLHIAREIDCQLKEAQLDLAGIRGDEPISQIIGLAENRILDFTNLLNANDGRQIESFGVGLNEYVQHLIDNPRDIIGISTGYKWYDSAIGGGLRRKTVNLIGARPKIGKTQLVDNIGVHIAEKLGIPVLNLDTEMDKEAHWNRILANLSNVEIDDIETGKFGSSPAAVSRVQNAAETLASIPYSYLSIAGQSFEDTLAAMRRWVMREVGYDENGRTKDAVIIYDYIKLMTSDGLNSSMQEFQMLGFQMTALHNFMVRYDVPCLAFIQLNRDGISKESTDAASGSDRLIWLCSNFSIWKEKSDEEMAEDGTANGNRKLVPIVARHGGGLEDGDYINFQFDGKYGRIKELRTRREANAHNPRKGFESEIGDDEELDI